MSASIRTRTLARGRIRIRRVVAVAAVLPVLALAAACSSDGGKSDDAKKKDGVTTSPAVPSTAAPTAAAKPPLTEAQLRAVLVKDADLPGYKVEASTSASMSADDKLTTDKPQCQPLADPVGTKPKYVRKAYAGASVAKKDALGSGAEVHRMLLASHAPGDAGKMMAELKRALDTCTAFIATAGTGKKIPFTITKAATVTAGDEAVSYVMADTSDKVAGAALVTVVRSGDDSITFLSAKLTGGQAAAPVDVARKQDAKLKAATAGS
ncbi:hypothetical protein QMK19_14870 [Streptomyces sp. H10-C2]|uniref:hypothetical protein n=1 Tax=unclassified Streptomyces TaxID=2593676 RepID=UPI0024B8A98A|nr:MULTISPECIES: hypothetical protein [unclassified Streptomyces]MDJ0341337.1 hypothetical protein [Streptomyces sp. PH10-H1]MDJ0370932.1 hypothetical protein [Streptomyces sp. H10-C2]